MNTKKIKSILVDGDGTYCATKETPIEQFNVNGEMALVSWYHFGKYEFNGKYVIRIEYFTQEELDNLN